MKPSPAFRTKHRTIHLHRIGGDPVIGTNFIDALTLFNRDPETRAVVMVGKSEGRRRGSRKIHQGKHEETRGRFIAGRTAPPGRRMGHAGAIISGGKGTAAEKIEAMQQCGIHVALSPADIGETLARLI